MGLKIRFSMLTLRSRNINHGRIVAQRQWTDSTGVCVHVCVHVCARVFSLIFFKVLSCSTCVHSESGAEYTVYCAVTLYFLDASTPFGICGRPTLEFLLFILVRDSSFLLRFSSSFFSEGLQHTFSLVDVPAKWSLSTVRHGVR